MRLLRCGPTGAERPAMLDAEGRIRDLSAVVPDLAASVLTEPGLGRLRALDPERLPLVDAAVRIGPCVGGVSKIIGVGLNYADHAAQAGLARPSSPTLFMKAPSSICGPDDDLVIPPGSSATDWEIELGVVIGARVSRVAPEHALGCVAGYCIADDVTERDWIASSGQLLNGKCADSFTALGPWLATPEEIGDPQQLELRLSLNGERRQSGNTADMIVPIDALISHVSTLTTLLPGDVILTGTPAGVGMRSRPQRYLRPGDRLELEIVGLGRQRQSVVAAA